MRLQTKLVSAVIFCGMLMPLCSAAPAPSTKWVPDRAHLAKLAPAARISSYLIQPPRGYTFNTRPGPGGTYADAWVGPTHADGTRSYLMVVFLVPSAGDRQNDTLAQGSAKMLAGVQRRRKNWKQSPTQRGSVHGITFLRTYWQGTDIASGKPMYGFSYFAKYGNTFLQISSQDVVPYQTRDLPIAEASALTFRKQ